MSQSEEEGFGKTRSFLQQATRIFLKQDKVNNRNRVLHDKGDFVINLDVVDTFPSYGILYGGSTEFNESIVIETINQIFPSLSSLAKNVQRRELCVKKIESLSEDLQNKSSSMALEKLFNEYGSDKASSHKYHHLYGAILRDNLNILNIFEIGLGTNNVEIPCNMGRDGKPGASLRAFRDFCPRAHVYGADIDKSILFEEERIKTFFVDQTKPATFDALRTKIPNDFDLVIDDGFHCPMANIYSLEFGLKIVKVGGWVVVEDIDPKAIYIWKVVSALLPDDYESCFFSDVGEMFYVFAVKRLK